MQTVRKLYEIEKCSKRGLYSFLNSEENRNFKTTIFLTNLFKEYGLSFTNSIVSDMLDEDFKTGFINKKEEEFFKNSLINKLMRFKNYLDSNGYNLVEKPSTKIVEISKESIRIKYDLVLEKDGVIFVSRVKNSKPDLKLSGRKDETALYKSIELYSLYTAGQNMFPNKEIKGAIFYLTNDMDSINYNNLADFEFKKGKNIVSYSFDEKSDIVSVNKRLEKILNNKECGDCSNCYYDRLCNFVKSPKIESSVTNITDNSLVKKNIELTDSQKMLIWFSLGVCRVSAIAGSGKSTVLARRFIELVKSGIEPKKILGLTFTVQGVIELKEKIKYWGNYEGVDCSDIKISTFNQFCFDLIKENHVKLGYTETPKVLDRLDKVKIISNLLDKNKPIAGFNYSNPLMDFYKAKGAVFACIELIESIDIGQPLSVEEVSEITRLNEASAEILLNIFTEYKRFLIENNFITIENQIELGSKLLKPAMVDVLGYEHIVVDEAQDTNMTQLNILLKLHKYHNFKSLAICGDDSQSIYGWRGADNEILVELDKYFPELFDIKLEDNFRSTQEICNLANRINNNNTIKIEKKMKAHKRGKKPTINESDIVDIAKEIQQLIINGENLKDIAFIARNKSELIEMQLELKKLGIPSDIKVSQLLIENSYFKNISDLANFFINNEDSLGFSNYLNMVKYNEFNSVKNLEEFIKVEKEELINKLDSLSDEEKLEYYLELISDLAKESNAIEFFISLIKEKGFKNINELANFTKELINFKSDIVIEKNSDNEDSVTLITAHSSKGKEYKNVLISLDNFKKKYTDDKEEERRLIYVAVTRAQEVLKLFYKKDYVWQQEIRECINLI